jgi:hypothetical protein
VERNARTKVKAENGRKNALTKSALLLFFGATIIGLVRAGAVSHPERSEGSRVLAGRDSSLRSE